MLIFKIICIIILSAFILFGFVFKYTLSKDIKEDNVEDAESANGVIKATWVLLIGFGITLIYIIMN